MMNWLKLLWKLSW